MRNIINVILIFFLQADFEEQYDIVQKIGEGWFSRVYLTEHRRTHQEMVLKAINSKNMSVEEFLREFHHSLLLGSHRNILTVFPDMVFTIGNIRPPAFGLYKETAVVFFVKLMELPYTFRRPMLHVCYGICSSRRPYFQYQ